MDKNNVNFIKVTIFYFSGTGNTAWAVNKLADKLGKLNYKVKLMSCEYECNISLEIDSCDIVGLAFPIHSSFAPSLFQNFFEKLPACRGKALIALTTAAMTAGDVLWHELKKLRNRGYIPLVFSNIIIGNNMHLPLLSPIPVTKSDRLRKNLEKADKKIDKMVNYIIENTKHIEGTNIFGRLLGITQRSIAEKFESLAFKGFYADESCIKCGWCVNNCPVKNIQKDVGGVKFLNNCMLCMRCYSFCPNQSIQLTEKTKDTKRYERYKGPKELEHG